MVIVIYDNDEMVGVNLGRKSLPKRFTLTAYYHAGTLPALCVEIDCYRFINILSVSLILLFIYLRLLSRIRIINETTVVCKIVEDMK